MILLNACVGIRKIRDQENRIELTGDIELCGPDPTLSVCKCSSNAVGVCFKDGTACTGSTICAVVNSCLLTAICLGASVRGVKSHLILGH